ncbi:MAG TPA: hypothetical protein VFY40_19585, partial [Blastocatellia bacterium]|nr:hypothetical protein [Blastocatellia bacterium]
GGLLEKRSIEQLSGSLPVPYCAFSEGGTAATLSHHPISESILRERAGSVAKNPWPRKPRANPLRYNLVEEEKK